jgi:hypothetical protein
MKTILCPTCGHIPIHPYRGIDQSGFSHTYCPRCGQMSKFSEQGGASIWLRFWVSNLRCWVTRPRMCLQHWLVHRKVVQIVEKSGHELLEARVEVDAQGHVVDWDPQRAIARLREWAESTEPTGKADYCIDSTAMQKWQDSLKPKEKPAPWWKRVWRAAFPLPTPDLRIPTMVDGIRAGYREAGIRLENQKRVMRWAEVNQWMKQRSNELHRRAQRAEGLMAKQHADGCRAITKLVNQTVELRARLHALQHAKGIAPAGPDRCGDCPHIFPTPEHDICNLFNRNLEFRHDDGYVRLDVCKAKHP